MRPGDLFNKHKKESAAHERRETKAHERVESKAVEAKENKKTKKNWIAGAIKHPGALHRQLGVPAGKKIPGKKLTKAASKKGVIGKRARLAQTLRSFHSKKHVAYKKCKTCGM